MGSKIREPDLTKNTNKVEITIPQTKSEDPSQAGQIPACPLFFIQSYWNEATTHLLTLFWLLHIAQDPIALKAWKYVAL